MSKLVLLRGLAREQGHWGMFPDLLRTALPSCPVVTIDLAGNGSEHRMRSFSRIEALTAECRARLQGVNGPGPYHLVGLSLGGMVATAWMQEHPGEVASGVLINTSLRPYSPSWRRMRPSSALRLLVTLAVPAQRAERTILELTSEDPGRRRDALETWVALRRIRPVSARNALRQLVAAARYRALPFPPEVPVLVVTSAGDRLVASSCSRDIAARWKCRIVEHPSAGHELALDDPVWLAGQIARWVAERELRSAHEGALQAASTKTPA